MNDAEYSVTEPVLRPVWLWILGIPLLVVVIAIAGFFMSGTPAPGWMAHADKDQLGTLYKRRPRDNEVAYYYSHALMKDGDTGKAYKLMAEVLAREPRSTRYLLRFAHYAAMRGHARETVETYRKILAIDPADAESHAEIGQILVDAGMLSEALQEYDQAVKLNPKVAFDPQRYAKCLIQSGRYAEAWGQVEGSINTLPYQDTPYNLLTTAGIKLGKFDETEVWLLRRMQLDPEYPLNMYQHSLSRLAMARPRTAATLKEAEDWARLSTQKVRGSADQNPVLPEYYAQFATILQERGRPAEARIALQRGLKLDSANKECLLEMVHLCERTGDSRAAAWRAAYSKAASETEPIAALRRAMAAKPTDPAPALALAAALEKKERYTDAADVCGKIFAISPNDPTATSILDRCRTEALKRLEAEARKRYNDLDAGT